MPTRTYPGVERRVGRDGLETHAIEVLYQPCQILALQVWNGALKLVLSNAADELLVKLWRSRIEVAELLQRLESDHGDVWRGKRHVDLVG